MFREEAHENAVSVPTARDQPSEWPAVREGEIYMNGLRIERSADSRISASPTKTSPYSYTDLASIILKVALVDCYGEVDLT